MTDASDRKSSPPSSDELGGMVKGASFRELIRWARSRFGEDVLRKGYERLRPEDQALVEPGAPAMGVVATRWYPMRLAATFSDTYLEGTSGEDRRQLIREATRFSMDRTLKGVQRMIFQVMMTPERAARHMNKIWHLNYDSGEVRWEVVAPGHIEASIRDWPGHTTDFCTMLQEMEIYFLELIGCENVRSARTACVGRGDPACTSTLTWNA
ncbi:MAG: hypothetical protein ACOC97_02295 [Myxococcota bacterium]